MKKSSVVRKLQAIGLLALMLSLPLYSASVYAEISSVRVHGQNNVDDYIKERDRAEIVVTASIPGDYPPGSNGITGDQLKLGGNTGFSCSPATSGTNNYVCTISDPPSGTKLFSVAEIPYTVTLYNDAGGINAQRNFDAIVDKWPPTVKQLTASPAVTNTGEVTLSYNVEDYAYTNGDTSDCSGLKTLQLYLNDFTGTPVETVELDGSCSQQGQAQFTATTPGQVKVCAKAVDRLDQAGQAPTAVKCTTFKFDNTAPDYIPNTFVLSKDGQPLRFVGTQSIPVTLNITLSDDVDPATVKADLRPLNTNPPSDYAAKPAVCDTPLQNQRICRWNFEIRVANGGTFQIATTFKDTAGNEKNLTLPLTLGYDTQGPRIIALRSEANHNNKHYAKSLGNNFTAELIDEAGVKATDMILHLGSSSLPATRCDPAGSSNWLCHWENVAVTAPDRSVLRAILDTDSKDILGNRVAERREIDVTVDRTVPVRDSRSIEVLPVGGQQEAVAGFIKIGDKLQINVPMRDWGPLRGYADLSAFIQGATKVAANDCQYDRDNEYTCIWSTDQGINVQGLAQRTARIWIEDIAGNKAQQLNVPVRVLGRETQAVNQFYEIGFDTARMPAIDRQVIRNLASSSYIQLIPITLTYNRESCQGNNAEIANARTTGTCSGTKPLLVKQGSDYSGFVQVPIATAGIGQGFTEYPISSEGQECYLEYNLRCGNDFYTVPEQIELAVNVPVIETQDAVDSILGEIEDIKEGINDFDKVLDALDKVLKFMKTLCGMKATFAAINHIWDAIATPFAVCIDSEAGRVLSLGSCDASERGAAGGKQATNQGFLKGLSNLMDSACSFATCRSSSIHVPIVNKDFDIGFSFCDTLKNAIGNDITGRLGSLGGGTVKGLLSRDQEYYEQDTLEIARKSFVFSLACGCLPGMIYNIRKHQQIECKKGVCLRDLTPVGVPKSECEQQHDYEMCVYWAGQTLVPSFLDIIIAQPIKNIVNVIENPIATGYMVMREIAMYKCSMPCQNPESGGVCTVHWTSLTSSCKLVSVLLTLETAAQIAGYIGSDEWKLEQEVNYCDILTQDPVQQQTQ